MCEDCVLCFSEDPLGDFSPREVFFFFEDTPPTLEIVKKKKHTSPRGGFSEDITVLVWNENTGYREGQVEYFRLRVLSLSLCCDIPTFHSIFYLIFTRALSLSLYIYYIYIYIAT